MKAKLAHALPFASAAYCLVALVLVCQPPWVIDQGPGDTGRLFEGYGLLWARVPHQATQGLVDWSSLGVELLALLLVFAVGFSLYACWLQLRSGSRVMARQQG